MYPIHETSSKERNPTNEALEIASVHHGLENLAGNTNSNLRSIRACTGTPGQGSSPALVPRGLPPHCRTRIYLPTSRYYKIIIIRKSHIDSSILLAGGTIQHHYVATIFCFLYTIFINLRFNKASTTNAT